MSNLSPSHLEVRTQVRTSSLVNRSLWLTLVLALGLIAALFFVFSARTLAVPSETTITQRVQNTGSTSTGTITGTYGEVLTVTMRFTVTTGTVLTGPITLGTRFATFTPTNQLGFRFLGYQGPITAAAGTPDLPVVNFVSNTVGTTTYLTWTFDTITNTSGSSYAYEVPYQARFVWDGVADAGSSAAIPNVANETKIVWSPGGAGNTKSANGLTVNLVKPDLGPTYSTKAFRAVPGVQGGATVVYTVTLKNGNNTTNFSTAYDLAVTDSLDSRVTYVSASPAPSGFSAVAGQNTIITWTAPNWSLAPNASWIAYVTATLPATIPANPRYLNSVTPYYTTRSDVAPDEASYTPLISVTTNGGIIGTKRANPADNIRIGDAVTYTVQFTLSPNVYLQTPIFTDTLPDGFHYRSASFSLNGTTLSSPVVTTTSGTDELLRWAINDVPAGSSQQVFTAVYVADVTGINADGSLAYAANAGQFTAKQSAVNSVQGTWKEASGTTLGLLAPLASTALVAQPYLNNTDFGVGIFGWKPITASQEVGSIAVYTLSVKNTGTITAYEVLLSDQLPPGVTYQGNLLVNPSNLQIDVQPNVGDSGAIQFGIQELPAGTKAILTFDALAGNTARPGDLLIDTLSLLDYRSQPGEAFTRHYNTIALAVPAPKTAPFLLKGLNAVKTDVPDPVLPGQVLTYFISYSNTSAVYTANNVQLVDTYDPLLTFSNATPAPSSQDPSAHTLTWNAGTLGANSGNNLIVATFQVATGISRTVRVITNTIASDSDAPAPPMSRIVTTTLVQPKPTISLDDKGVTVTANSIMTYTLIYSNASAATGATTGTFSITLDYAPYITFITSTGRLPVPGTGGTLFTDTLGPGISRTVQLRMQVARPLPYDLTAFTSTATIYQPDADISDTDSEETSVLLPLYQLTKNRSTPGNPPVNANDLIAYIIAVTNTSSITGSNIIITDVWDVNTYSHIGSSKWTVQPTYAVYTTIAALGPGASVQLDPLNMNVTATLPSNAQIIHNAALLTSRETTQQETDYDTPIAGLYIQKTHQPDPVYPGQVLTYTINYIAYSPAIVTPVVTDTLPPQVTYLSCAGAESCNTGGGKVVWSWPSGLIQGNSGVITVVVQAPNTEWITLTNTYASNSAGGAPYREGPPDYTYVGRPHMSITKQASTAVTPPAPGDLIIYSLTYTNSGSYKATGVVAHDTVPANTTFSSCSGAPCSESNGIVDWTVGEVPIATTGTLTMIVRVNPGAGTTTIVNNIYSLTADRNVVNENTPPVVNVAVVRPALSMVKSVSPAWIALGSTVTYTVRYTNTGGGTFTTLHFTDAVDSRLNIQSASGNCTTGGNNVYCADANLVPGQSRQFTITVGTVSVGNSEVVTNAASYLAANQTEALPQGMSNVIEVPSSNAGAAADFVGAPASGPFPLNVTFTNLSSAASGVSINSCSWNFGDSSNSASACQPGNQVNHTYNQAGIYTVSLTINTNSGSGTNTRTRPAYITASGAATFGVSIASPQSNKSGPRGSQVVYTLIITNTGNALDTFTLSKSAVQWPTDLNPATVGPLALQGTATVYATVTIPSLVSLNASDTVTITATSQGNTSIKSSVALKTSVLTYPMYLPLVRKSP